MWPTLIAVGPVAIQSFGTMLAVGLFLGGFVLWSRGKEEGFEEEELMDGWIVAAVISLLVSRAWYILSHWPEFGGSWYKMLFLTKFPGLSYSGAWVGAGLSLTIFGLKKKWDWWCWAEMVVLALLVTELFGWIGSFLSGSMLGQETSWWWGLQFPGVEGGRHPVQLLFFLGGVILWRLLKRWEKSYRTFGWYQQRKEEAQPGFLVAVYLFGLGSLPFQSRLSLRTRQSWYLPAPSLPA